MLVGISSGTSYGALGTTHHSLHDLAVLRAINNLTIIVPADNFESRQVILAAAKATKPVFVRFGKAAMYGLLNRKRSLKSAKPSRCAKATMWRSSPTAKRWFMLSSPPHSLPGNGIQARVLSVHTVKPLDTEAILKAGRECKAVVTVEEHMVQRRTR
ncbi:MAG: transketolase C-terminal domain-containing protein [Verrucomicrobiota bacterium]